MTKILAFIGGAFLSVVAIVLAVVAWFMFSLPDVEKIKGCLTTEMFQVKLCETDPGFVKLDSISPYIIGALIMSEDASFFDHEGVDVHEMKESLLKNLSQGRYARGGSTITQQLVKNVFLSGEKSLLRKMQEIYLALQVEKILTKNKILTLYLNVVEFGDKIYGVRAATRYYFSREPNHIAPEQAAFLIFLLPNPKKYAQSFQKKQLTPFATKSIKTILHKMYRGKKISEGDYKESVARVATLFGSETQMAPPSNEPEDNETILDEILNQSPEEDFNFDQKPESI